MEREKTQEAQQPPVRLTSDRGSERWKRIVKYGVACAVGIPLFSIVAASLVTGFDYQTLFAQPSNVINTLILQFVAGGALGAAIGAAGGIPHITFHHRQA